MRALFPDKPADLAAMFACYALTALTGWMVLHPQQVFAFFTGA